MVDNCSFWLLATEKGGITVSRLLRILGDDLGIVDIADSCYFHDAVRIDHSLRNFTGSRSYVDNVVGLAIDEDDNFIHPVDSRPDQHYDQVGRMKGFLTGGVRSIAPHSSYTASHRASKPTLDSCHHLRGHLTAIRQASRSKIVWRRVRCTCAPSSRCTLFMLGSSAGDFAIYEAFRCC